MICYSEHMEEIMASLKVRLKEILHFDLLSYKEINAGTNNKLFCLTSANNKLLLKIYTTHDDRQRLTREFQACTFLHSRNITQVPKAYLKDEAHNYAVYSFETGITKTAAELSRSDLDAMVSFTVSLQAIPPENVSEKFLPAVMVCFSLQDYVENIDARLQKVKKHVREEGWPTLVTRTIPQDYEETIHVLVENVLKEYRKDEIHRQIKDSDRRLSPVDFGPHNALFKENGEITYVDLEYFGWDDPNRWIGDFLNHDQLAGLSDEKKTYVLQQYKKASTLPKESLDRLDVVIKLIAIEWLTIYLLSMTREKLEIRKFADSNFNEEQYIQEQVKKYNEKLKTLRQ